MPKRTGLAAAGVTWGIVLVLLAGACAKATPPPLTPDGPDMDLDAAVYQDDAAPS